MSKAHINIRAEVAEHRKSELNKDPKIDVKDGLAATLMKAKENADFKDLEKIILEQSKELTLRSKAIDALQRNFESLSNFCKTEKNRSQYLVQQVEELSQENEKLNIRIKELSGVKAVKPEEVEGARTKALKNDLETLKEQNGSLERKVAKQSAELDKLQDNLRKMRFEREKNMKETNTLKDILGKKERQLKEQEQDMTSLKHSLSELSAQIEAQSMQLKESNLENEKLQNKIEQTSQANKISQAVIDGLHKRISENEEQISKLKEAMHESEVTRSSENGVIEQLRAQCNTLLGDCESSHAQIDSLKQELSTSQYQLIEMRNNYENIQGQFKLAQSLILSLEEKEESYITKLTVSEKQNSSKLSDIIFLQK